MEKTENKKYKMLYVYAFYKENGPEGVSEDLCTDVTIQEGIAHIKNIYHDAHEFRVSDIQMGSPYYFLFAPDRSPEEISKYIIDMDPQEISDLVSHLDELNEPILE